jgi:hypothetical protein
MIFTIGTRGHVISKLSDYSNSSPDERGVLWEVKHVRACISL